MPSQDEAMQRKKAVLQQYLNPQLKPLVRDENFVIVMPLLFGQRNHNVTIRGSSPDTKTQPKIFRSTTPRNRASGVIGVAAKEAMALAERETGKLGV